MRVKVEFTVVVDPEAWADEYGLPLSEVRADVQTYIEQHMEGMAAYQKYALITSITATPQRSPKRVVGRRIVNAQYEPPYNG